MMQVTEMPFEEYNSYLFDYQELMESDDDDIVQKARCAFGIDLYLRQEINEKTQLKNDKERNDEIYEILKEHSHFSDDKILKLANDYIEIKTAFQIYDKAFELYFKEFSGFFERLGHN